MVQYNGTTYRIVKRGDLHEIVRVLDDTSVGSFRRTPRLELVECRIDRDVVLAIARSALHAGRLSYEPKRDPSRGYVPDWLEAFRWNDLPAVLLLLGVASRLAAT